MKTQLALTFVLIFAFNISVPVIVSGDENSLSRLSQAQLKTFETLISVSRVINLPVLLLNNIMKDQSGLTNLPASKQPLKNKGNRNSELSKYTVLQNTLPNISKLCLASVIPAKSFTLGIIRAGSELTTGFASIISNNLRSICILMVFLLIMPARKQSHPCKRPLFTIKNPFHVCAEWVFYFMPSPHCKYDNEEKAK